jgi:hypothetical protein
VSEIFGIAEVQRALDKMLVQAREAAKKIVKRSEVVVESEAKWQFIGAHKPNERTMSRPGEPPEVVSGTLRRSIKSDPVTLNGFVAHGSVYRGIRTNPGTRRVYRTLDSSGPPVHGTRA